VLAEEGAMETVEKGPTGASDAEDDHLHDALLGHSSINYRLAAGACQIGTAKELGQPTMKPG
jgi:hypothetical protein